MDQLYQAWQQSTGVCTDTRKLSDGCLYWALVGERFDGNEFVQDALDQGATFAVSSSMEWKGDERVFIVEDTLVALQELANHHRHQLSYPILALTGSNGKTTTKELITRTLEAKYTVGYTKGNLNNHIGVPLTLLDFPHELGVGVVEMGANHQKEIAALCRIAEPDMGLITNIGMAHLEGFGGLMGVRKGKGEMYDFLKSTEGIIFCNESQQFLREMLNDYEKAVTYSHEEFVVHDQYYVVRPISGVNCGLVISNREGEYEIQTQLVGDYNISNLITAIVIGLYFEIPLVRIAEQLNGFGMQSNRSQLKRVNDVDYVLDAYNANPSSMMAALDNMSRRTGRKGLILGEMLELGEESEYRHRLILEEISNQDYKAVYLIGRGFSSLSSEFDQFQYFDDIQSAVEQRASFEEQVDTCLMKGSRSNALEKWFAQQ